MHMLDRRCKMNKILITSFDANQKDSNNMTNSVLHQQDKYVYYITYKKFFISKLCIYFSIKL